MEKCKGEVRGGDIPHPCYWLSRWMTMAVVGSQAGKARPFKRLKNDNYDKCVS